MRFLLVLSALLSAIVGFGVPAVAAVRPASEVTVSAGVRIERTTLRRTVIVPRQVGTRRNNVFRAIALDVAPVQIVPIYIGRLRV